MNQCLMITLTVGSLRGFLDRFIKNSASKLHLEGVAQLISDSHVRIIVCGQNKAVDDFIDVLYEQSTKFKLDDIQIESYFKERDYRGVFRVIA